jgi:hypothetical protein
MTDATTTPTGGDTVISWKFHPLDPSSGDDMTEEQFRQRLIGKAAPDATSEAAPDATPRAALDAAPDVAPIQLVVDPRGQDKTQFLGQLLERMKAGRLAGKTPRSVLSLDARKVFENKPSIDEALHDWLAESEDDVLEPLRMYHDRNVDPRSVFAVVVERLTDEAGNVVFLLDNIDQVGSDQARASEQMLRTFLSASGERGRAVVHTRTPENFFKTNYDLSWLVDTFELTAQEQAAAAPSPASPPS